MKRPVLVGRCIALLRGALAFKHRQAKALSAIELDEIRHFPWNDTAQKELDRMLCLRRPLNQEDWRTLGRAQTLHVARMCDAIVDTQREFHSIVLDDNESIMQAFLLERQLKEQKMRMEATVKAEEKAKLEYVIAMEKRFLQRIESLRAVAV